MRPSLILLVLPLVAASCAQTSTVPRFDRPDAVPAALAAAIEDPDAMTLITLEPNYQTREELEAAEQTLHGYIVLGEAPLNDRARRAELVGLLYESIAGNHGIRANCFLPRHGIRVTHDGVTHEWLICFECLSMNVHDGSGERPTDLGTLEDVEPRVSAIYREVGLTIAD